MIYVRIEQLGAADTSKYDTVCKSARVPRLLPEHTSFWLLAKSRVGAGTRLASFQSIVLSLLG